MIIQNNIYLFDTFFVCNFKTIYKLDSMYKDSTKIFNIGINSIYNKNECIGELEIADSYCSILYASSISGMKYDDIVDKVLSAGIDRIRPYMKDLLCGFINENEETDQETNDKNEDTKNIENKKISEIIDIDYYYALCVNNFKLSIQDFMKLTPNGVLKLFNTVLKINEDNSAQNNEVIVPSLKDFGL